MESFEDIQQQEFAHLTGEIGVLGRVTTAAAWRRSGLALRLARRESASGRSASRPARKFPLEWEDRSVSR